MSQAWMIDDDEEISQAMKMMLKLLGFDLRIFTDARSAAKALLASTPPAVLFLDLNMPEVTGIDLLEFIRSKPRWNLMPVVMLSAETADVTVDDALERGADAYLFKPVSLAELKAGITHAFQMRQTMGSQPE